MNKKRAAAAGIEDVASPQKRQKVADQTKSTTSSDLSITDLRRLLAFSQDGGEDIRNNVRQVRGFLDSIEHSKGTDIAASRLSSLYAYLENVIPHPDDPQAPVLSDFLQTWSFAAHAGNRALLTAITSTLALLLKVISTELRFRKQGIAICQATLKEDNIKLLKDSLSVNRSQEQLLSASLRLLTEVVSFDGGACARGVYRQREALFKRLDELLGSRTGASESKKGQHTSSLRLNAVRFLLANLRVQDPAIKTELVSDPKRVRALIQNIGEDSASTIALTLQTLDTNVLGDSGILRQTKGRLLTESSLIKLASLYTFQDSDDETSQGLSVPEAVHKFLLKACCNPEAGVLHTTNGWYGPRSEKEITPASGEPRFPEIKAETTTINAPPHIANNKLAGFMQELRPYASVQHRELVLEIFKAAPELVADYFHRKRNFSFEPKLTSTWIGFSSFVLSMTQLPIPSFEITRALPRVATVLENVLPASLTKKSLTRCFTQESTLIRMFGAKLIISASHKLATVLRSLDEQAAAWPGRHQWKADILGGFSERCPDVQTIIKALQACKEDQVLLKEALLAAISAISAVHPRLMVQANFHVSLLLADALGDDHSSQVDIRNLIVEHLLHIASLTDLDWFRKKAQLAFSPFTTVLRLYADNSGTQFEKLLKPVLYDSFVLQQSTSPSAFEALVLSIQQSTQIDALYEFVDNCLTRFMQNSIKYESDLESLCTPDPSAVVSLLTVVIHEQWPHFVKAHFEDEVSVVACWIARWLSVCEKIGEDEGVLSILREKLLESTPSAAADLASQIPPVAFPDEGAPLAAPMRPNGTQSDHADSAKSKIALISESFTQRLQLPEHGDSYPELHRWTKKSIPDAIEESDLTALLFCLSAADLNIRRQALSQLRRLAATVQESDYAEKSQLYLLLMEVVETGTQNDLAEALPTIVPALASALVLVLHDPTHFMYTKANKFLLKAPEWTLRKLPSYWMSKIMYAAPTIDVGDGYTREVSWLMRVLIEGMRTPLDVDLYRKCAVWEHVLVKDETEEGARRRDLMMDLLWRTTTVAGGSDTLVTRFGILSWLKVKILCNGDDARFGALRERVLSTCSKERLKTWGKGQAVEAIDDEASDNAASGDEN